MPNKIIVEIEALDYTVNERDVSEAMKSHFPNMPTRVHEIRPTLRAADAAIALACRNHRRFIAARLTPAVSQPIAGKGA